MVGEGEAIGDLVTGGLMSRAVEPAAGERRAGHGNETDCLNCGAELAGAFCQDCGQHAHVHRTLSAFGYDFLHGALNFEGKIWNTLPMLAWRPGDLTRRYIAGERARFVSPLALFLVSVFLMFAVIQSIGGSINDSSFNGDKIYHSTDAAIAGTQRDLAGLERRRAKASAGDIAEIDRQISAQRESLGVLTRLRQQGLTNAILAGGEQDRMAVRSSIPWLNVALQKAKANPQLALYKVQAASSKYSWLLIPISIPFLWLLFPFSRRFRMYDHAVFVTYSLAFVTLLVAATTVIGVLGFPGAAAVAALYMPFHMYRQLKGAYSLGSGGALWRTALLLMFALVALTLFALAVVALGVSD